MTIAETPIEENDEIGLVKIAEYAAFKKKYLRAFEIAREAILTSPNHEAYFRGRRLLSGLISGYHIPMMNDARRNAAWDKALCNPISSAACGTWAGNWR